MHGKKWRIADVDEVASVDGSYFVATFFVEQFEECIDVFRENGSRMVGPFTVQQLLVCVEIGEFVSQSGNSFLSQKKPGEQPITAGFANGLKTAADRFWMSKPDWKRENL